MMRRSLAALLAAGLLCAAAPAPAGQWLRSWQAVPISAIAVPAPAAAPAAAAPAGAAPAAPAPVQPAAAPPPPLADVTFRTMARLSAGGSMLRLRLSNELSTAALKIDAAHVALADASGRIIPGSDRTVTFSGAASTTIPGNAPMVSDAVALQVPALAHLMVSLYVAGPVGGATIHGSGGESTWIAPGNLTAATDFPTGRTNMNRYILSGVDVLSTSQGAGTIVALGDSITEGARTTPNTDRRWPDLLAERLQSAGRTGLAVANAGISGNRLLEAGSGPSVLARFDRDVLAAPGVRYVILLEGVNDIGRATREGRVMLSASQITDIYQQVIDRAHAQGVKVIGATVLPYKGASYYAEDGDAVRQAVNAWIKAPGHFDGVIDFDQATRDPADPKAMAANIDSGDKLHPGDEGNRIMAQAIDLSLFR